MTNTEGPTRTLDAGERPSPQELVERAREMIPLLRERAPQTEELRRLPDETLQDFVDAGFIRAALPEKWGGFGYDLEVIADIAGEIGRGCGSSGWLSSFYPCHQFIVTWFSDEAQADYFGTSGPDTLSSTVSAVVRCEREEVDGGILVSGQWKFSSGVDHAEWVLLHTPEEGTLIPRSDFEIHDDWYVSGLRGTGSKGVILDKVFVPRHRIVTNEEYFTIQFPGAKTSDSPYSKIVFPEATVMPNLMLAPIIGMAQGCLDVFEERVKSRKDPLTMQPAIERTAPQARFAEASAEVEAARLFMRHDLARLRKWGETGEITMEERAALRRNVTYATTLCSRAANRLVDGMDSSALYESNMLHRLARDVRAGTLQFALAWDESALQYSRVKWGLEPQTVII